jgi:Phage Mu protein F like protein
MFAQQARWVLANLNLDRVAATGRAPDLTPWIQAMANACKPLLLGWWQQGMRDSRRRVAQLVGNEREPALSDLRTYRLDVQDVFRPDPRKEVAGYAYTGVGSTTDYRSEASLMVLGAQQKRLPSPPGWQFNGSLRPNQIGIAFDIYNPRVLDAVDQATMQFCRETNETAAKDLDEAIKDLRDLLKSGIERGDALRYLAGKVGEIFQDPYRSYRLAATETSRAVHAGGLMAAKESPLPLRKQWLAAPDACELCLDLDSEERDLDEPFVVDGVGPYAVIQHPPRHPHCFCTWTEVLA